jgi:glutamyl-tRNA reductase
MKFSVRLLSCILSSIFAVTTLFLSSIIIYFSTVVSALSSNNQNNGNTFVILGGTGKMGTAVAAHLLRREASCKILLVGRGPDGTAAIQEVQNILLESKQR